MQDTDLTQPVTEPETEIPRPRMRTRRGELSRARVLAAALELLERDGESALSMRRLAAELGSAPMSLYRHVANKEDLVDGVIALALSDLTTERPVGHDLGDRMFAWMNGLRKELQAHPSIIPLMRSSHLVLPAFLGPMEVLMREFRDANIPRPQAAKAAWELLSVTMNFIVAEQMVPASEQPLAVQLFASAEEHVDDLPLLADAMPDLSALSADDIFESSARHLVAGLRSELKAQMLAA
jgi:AcrR family transcriptional regulator